jgi:hypothetical protein
MGEWNDAVAGLACGHRRMRGGVSLARRGVELEPHLNWERKMRHTDSRFFIALLMLGALGSSAGAQQRAFYSSDARIRVTKGEPPPAPVPSLISRVSVKGNYTVVTIPPVHPAPAFNLGDYLDLSEPMLTSYLSVRDTFQLRLVSIVSNKATDPRVRDLALLIAQDRQSRMAQTLEVITDEGVGAEMLQRDPELARFVELLRRFDSTPSGPAFDAAFLQAEFFLHQNEVDVIGANIKNAHDDDLEDLLEDSTRALTQTREVIRGLIEMLGVSLP